MKNPEIIKDSVGEIIAIILYKNFKKRGTNFFTPDNFSQQLAFISRKKGEVIGAHGHKIIRRNVKTTQETLLIKKGRVKVSLYDAKKKPVAAKVLKAGDIILLAGGGHGFEALADLEMIEIKQGPYLGDDYKIKF